MTNELDASTPEEPGLRGFICPRKKGNVLFNAVLGSADGNIRQAGMHPIPFWA